MEKHKHVLRKNIRNQENKSIQCFIQKGDFSTQTNVYAKLLVKANLEKKFEQNQETLKMN